MGNASRSLAPAVAAGDGALAWLGRFDEAEQWLERVSGAAAGGGARDGA